MANVKDKIKRLQVIIATNSPIAIACWMAVQQTQTLEEKNKAGYTLFKLTVCLPIDHPTASLIPYRKNGLPHLGIFSDLRRQRRTLLSTYPNTCCTSAASWRRRGIPYQSRSWWNLASMILTFMGGTWSIWQTTIQCALSVCVVSFLRLILLMCPTARFCNNSLTWPPGSDHPKHCARGIKCLQGFHCITRFPCSCQKIFGREAAITHSSPTGRVLFDG